MIVSRFLVRGIDPPSVALHMHASEAEARAKSPPRGDFGPGIIAWYGLAPQPPYVFPYISSSCTRLSSSLSVLASSWTLGLRGHDIIRSASRAESSATIRCAETNNMYGVLEDLESGKRWIWPWPEDHSTTWAGPRPGQVAPSQPVASSLRPGSATEYVRALRLAHDLS